MSNDRPLNGVRLVVSNGCCEGLHRIVFVDRSVSNAWDVFLWRPSSLVHRRLHQPQPKSSHSHVPRASWAPSRGFRVDLVHVAMSTNRRILDQSWIDSWQGASRGMAEEAGGDPRGSRGARPRPSHGDGEPRDDEGGWVSLRSLVGMSTSESDMDASESTDHEDGGLDERYAWERQSLELERYSESSEEDSQEMMFTGAEFDEEERELGRPDLFLALFSYSGHEAVLRSIQSNYLPVYLEGPNESASHLPFLSFEDVAIFPNTRFGISNSAASLRKVALPARMASPPARNLIAVVFYFYGGLRKVGAIVELCIPPGDIEVEPIYVCCRQNFDLSTGQLIHEVRGGLSLPKRAVFSVPQGHQVSCVQMPGYLYRQHDLQGMSQQILTNVLHLGLYTVHPPESVTPSMVANWVASNGPFGYLEQRHLLNLDSCYDRLCTLNRLLNTSSAGFQCLSCGQNIAGHTSMILLSDTGQCHLKGTLFLNPNNVMHDIVLLGELHENAARLEGEPVSEHSWFPGYAWTILRCSSCSRHWGWKFDRVVEDKGRQVFWALSRKNFRFAEDLHDNYMDESTAARFVL